MGTKEGDRNRMIWKVRRDMWLAERPDCADCGTPLTGQWKMKWRGEGPKPAASMLELFRYAEPRRTPLLAQCVGLCRDCWLASLPRNEHGAGVVGINGCDCEPCRERRLAYARDRRHEAADQRQQRRSTIIAKGLVPPKSRMSKHHNDWNRSQAGRDHSREQRKRVRREWAAGRVCAHCGSDQNLRCTWKVHPGPLKSTNRIWAYGAAKRAELLQECHTLCVSCLYASFGQREKEKKR